MQNVHAAGWLRMYMRIFFYVFVFLGFQQGVPIFLIYAYHPTLDADPQGRFSFHGAANRGFRSGVILIPAIEG